MNHRRLWTGLFVVIVASFAVLIYFGTELYHAVPPIPWKVVTPDGAVVLRIAKGESACPHGLAAIFGRNAPLPCSAF